MNKDEQAIRALVDRWWAASRENDVDATLTMVADDVLFTVNGTEPFSRDVFEKQALKMKDVRMEGNTRVLEIEVLGDRAWMRAYLTVRMEFPDGNSMEREGYLLTILRREQDGRWVIFREANMLPAMDLKGAGAKRSESHERCIA
ncbi:MAG: SgcJ/EcaC family oxidoreductase [Flavobacteriales bacterium]